MISPFCAFACLPNKRSEGKGEIAKSPHYAVDLAAALRMVEESAVALAELADKFFVPAAGSLLLEKRLNNKKSNGSDCRTTPGLKT